MAKRMAAVSGLYSYTAKGLGHGPAITVGWSAIFGYGLVAMGSLLLVGIYVVEFFTNLGVSRSGIPGLFARAGHCGCHRGRRLLSSWLGGIRISAWFTVSVESIAIGVIAVLMIGYFAFKAPKVSLRSELVWNGNTDSLPLGIVVAVSAFVGFESATTLGGEAHRPFVNVPRAITWTPIVTGVLFVLAETAQDIALKEAPVNHHCEFHSVVRPDFPVFPRICRNPRPGDCSFMVWVLDRVRERSLPEYSFLYGQRRGGARIIGRTHPSFKAPRWQSWSSCRLWRHRSYCGYRRWCPPLERGLVTLFTLGAYGYLGSYMLSTASLPFFLRPNRRGYIRQLDVGRRLLPLALGAVFGRLQRSRIARGQSRRSSSTPESSSPASFTQHVPSRSG